MHSSANFACHDSQLCSDKKDRIAFHAVLDTFIGKKKLKDALSNVLSDVKQIHCLVRDNVHYPKDVKHNYN